MEHGWSVEGKKDRAARRVQERVVRAAIGRVGGRRSLRMAPAPARWTDWTDMVRGHRNIRGLPISFVGNAFERGRNGGVFAQAGRADATVESVVLQ